MNNDPADHRQSISLDSHTSGSITLAAEVLPDRSIRQEVAPTFSFHWCPAMLL